MQDYKKELIIKSAKERFAKFGLKKTSMTEIAADLKMSKATLYYYYKSKEEIYNDVIEFEISRLKNTCDDLLNNDNLSLEQKLIEYHSFRIKLFNEDTNLKELQIRAISHPHLLSQDDFYLKLIKIEEEFLFKLFAKKIEISEKLKNDLQQLSHTISIYIRGFSLSYDLNKKENNNSDITTELKFFIDMILITLKKIEKDNK